MLAGSISVMLVTDPVTSLLFMGAAIMLLVSAMPPAKATIKGMLVITIIAGMSVTFHVLRGDYMRAIDIGADLVTIAALALAIVSSTPMAAMLSLVSTGFRPFRRILPPEAMGLMFALMLRAIPEVARILGESRSAAKARGLDRSLRAILVPTTTRTVGFALLLGQALHARGIAEEGDAPARTRRQRRR
jgi:biotin transport system permease protein